MLQSMRSKIKGVVAFVLIGLLTIPLALVGVENLFYSNHNIGEAASVDGKIISEREVQIAIGRERQRLQAQLGDNIPGDFFSDERLRQPVIDSLVQRALIANIADTGNMTFTDATIDETIVTLPDFQVDGVFDQQRFVQVIRSIGHTPASFRALLKEDMLVNQMQSALVSTDFITNSEVNNTVALSRQTRDFSWVTLPLAGLPETMTVTQDEISGHYEENKSSYLSQEQVAIEYIDLNVSDIEKSIDIGEDEILQQYEQIVKNYTDSTEREAAHIMVEGDDDTAQQKITTIQEKLAAGEDFAALASEYSDDFGSRDNGGNLGVSSGDGFPEAFEEALSLLEEGQVSEPTEIDGATHFIKLLALTEKTAPTLEEQRTVIEAELKRAKAEEQFIQDSQALEDLSYNAQSLQEVGDELGLPVGKTGLFSRFSSDIEIIRDSRVLNAAFSEQVTIEGHSSEVLALSADRNVVVKMVEHKPVRTLTLEEKTGEITEELKLEKAKAQLAQQAQSIREALDAGDSIATVSEQRELTLSSQIAVQRNAANVPRELLDAIFALSVPSESNPVITDLHLDNGDYVLASLSKVTNGSVDDLEVVERNNLRNSLSSGLAGDAYRAWQDEIRKSSDIEIYSSESSHL